MGVRGFRRLVAVAALIVVPLGGCAKSDPPRSPGVHASTNTVPSVPEPKPAALAGGACLLLDYNVINQSLGTAFSVAASADKDDTFTCVVQSAQASYPDLTLAITATDLAVSDFQSDVVPKGAKAISKLGRIGYEIQRPAADGVGPTLEVGWLSGNARLIVLRYATAANASSKDVAALAAELVTLARVVDGTTV